MSVYICMYMYCYTQKGFICNKDYYYHNSCKSEADPHISILKGVGVLFKEKIEFQNNLF